MAEDKFLKKLSVVCSDATVFTSGTARWSISAVFFSDKPHTFETHMTNHDSKLLL